MDTKQAQQLASKLLSERYKKFRNEANWALHNEYLDLVKEIRDQMTYHEYLIRELSK